MADVSQTPPALMPDVRHQHLIVRAEIAKPPHAPDCEMVEQWMRDLIDAIDMKVMYGPKAMYCPVEGNRGMTTFAIIETSHIVAHLWDECVPPIMQLDVYTCSDLVVEDVVKAIEVFEPTHVEFKFLDREHNLTLLREK